MQLAILTQLGDWLKLGRRVPAGCAVIPDGTVTSRLYKRFAPPSNGSRLSCSALVKNQIPRR
ncbi:MAG: hypothetical protein ACRDH2_18220, partial [Anaerolineales bacterium]